MKKNSRTWVVSASFALAAMGCNAPDQIEKLPHEDTVTVAIADQNRSGVGAWEGSGTVFGKDGSEIGEFAITLDRTAIDERTIETKGSVVLASGEVIPIFQRTIESQKGTGFRLETNRGKGGGYCFGAGLCMTYEDAGDGKTFATTLVIDGPEKLRLLVTELDRGQAVRFIRQTLARKS